MRNNKTAELVLTCILYTSNKLLRIYRREGCSWILLRYKGKEDGYPWIFYDRADL